MLAEKLRASRIGPFPLLIKKGGIHHDIEQQQAGNGGNGWHMPLIKSQPILHACSCWKTFPPGKEDKLRPEVLLYIPNKKYCNICPNTCDILKRLPWVGVFNEGFLSRPAFLSNLIYMPCRVSFSSPILYYKLFHFRRVLRL